LIHLVLLGWLVCTISPHPAPGGVPVRLALSVPQLSPPAKTRAKPKPVLNRPPLYAESSRGGRKTFGRTMAAGSSVKLPPALARGISGSSSSGLSGQSAPAPDLENLPDTGGIALNGSGQTASSGDLGSGSPGGQPAVFTPPQVIFSPLPEYPQAARNENRGGKVQIKALVGSDGLVREAVIDFSSGDEDLDTAALNAVKSWKFAPAQTGWEKTAAWVSLKVGYQLKEED